MYNIENMTNTISKNNKYGLKKTDENYFKNKNKLYYLEIKNDPVKAKSSLISYYKRRYGKDFVLNLIETLGQEQALKKLSVYKNELKQLKKENPLLDISI